MTDRVSADRVSAARDAYRAALAAESVAYYDALHAYRAALAAERVARDAYYAYLDAERDARYDTD